MDLTRRMMRSSHAVLTIRRDRLTGLSRGMPRLEDILAIPRQLFDSICRLGVPSLQSHESLGQFERIAGIIFQTHAGILSITPKH